MVQISNKCDNGNINVCQMQEPMFTSQTRTREHRVQTSHKQWTRSSTELIWTWLLLGNKWHFQHNLGFTAPLGL